jgi:SAM-dependent methyltransferase
MVGLAGTVAWHDVECGSYGADLPLWRELATAAAEVLDLGCGSGRVALDLAAAGRRVCGVDSDPELVAALRGRARERGLEVDAVAADVRALSLGRTFGLAIAPMQVFQLLGGAAGRARALAAVREHLAPGGLLAVALADPFEAVPAPEALPPLPDVRERDGWVLSSTPVAVRATDGGVAIDRVRQAVSPAGELDESFATIVLDDLSPTLLENDAHAAGLFPAGRRPVEATADHVGSTVVLLEARP